MDFVIGLPKVKGKSVIMVVVDRLSNFCHLIPLPTKYSAHTVTKAFIDGVMKLHGISRSILSD